MDTQSSQTKENEVRLPHKEALHQTTHDSTGNSSRCFSCQSHMPEGADSCLACGAMMPVISSLHASQNTIELGQPIRISWSVEHATMVWFEGSDEAIPSSGQEDIYLRENTRLVLIAEGEAGQVEQELTFTLPAPDIRRYEVNDRQIDLHYPTIFSWEASNAEIITIEPAIGEVSGLSFCESQLSKPGVYELRVQNASGEARAKVFLTLPNPEINSFQILQDHVEPGEPHLLHWEIKNTDKLRLYPLDIDVTGQTQIEVFPDRSTAYRLVASNASGEVEERVFIPLPEPKITDFSSPHPVSTEGKSIELNWEVKYCYKVEIEPEIGEVPPSGTISFKPDKAFTTFHLKATGHSGVSTSELTVSRFPLPLNNLNENELFKDMHESIRKHEKIIREQARQQRAARFLPTDQQELSPDELLKKGSVGKELRKVIGSFFRK